MADVCPRCGNEHPPGACFSSIGEDTEGADDPGAAAAREPAPAALRLVGRMVGEYKVTGLIGEGGMGTVYAGVQPLIDKQVAIKVLKGALSHNPSDMRRFLSEARAVNRIRHANIVDVFSFGTLEDGAQYLVMERLEGQSLAQYLDERKTVSYADAVLIVGQMLDALRAAHDRKIVHRDLKPENVFLCARPDGGFVVKLLDFGLAKFTDDAGATSHTRTGVPMGTPLFMSPEQCRGRDVDHRADIYAVGVILFRMFTGSVPFSGSSLFDLMAAHLTLAPPAPRSLAQVPEELEAIILRCLAKKKDERPASTEELRAALMPVLERQASVGAAAPLQLATPPQVPAAASGTVEAAMAAATSPPVRRSRAGLVALVVAAVGIGALAVVLAIRPWRAPPPPPPVAPPPQLIAASAPPTQPTAAPASLPSTVTLRFRVTPPVPHELWVEGRKLERPEYVTRRDKRRTVEVKVLASGFQPYTTHAVPASDLTIPVTLVPERVARAGRPAPPRAARVSASKGAFAGAKEPRPTGEPGPQPRHGPRPSLIEGLEGKPPAK